MNDNNFCFDAGVYLPKSVIDRLRNDPINATITYTEHATHITFGEVGQCLSELVEIIDSITDYGNEDLELVGF